MTQKKPQKDVTAPVQSAAITNNNHKEAEMPNNAEQQEKNPLQDAITAIEKSWAKLESQKDKSAAEIARRLLEIKTAKLYKSGSDDNGKAFDDMSEFIKCRLPFSPQYGLTLMKSAQVKAKLGRGDEVSLRTLRPLNRYIKKDDALKAIWESAIEIQKSTLEERGESFDPEEVVPSLSAVKEAVRRWQADCPNDAKKFNRKTGDKIRESIEKSIQKIVDQLAKLDDEKTKAELRQKAQEAFGLDTTGQEGPTAAEENENEDPGETEVTTEDE